MRIIRRIRHLPWVARRLTRRERPIILMYHRVTTLARDPWGLAVAPDRFARQIELLCASRKVVPMGWLVRELSEGRIPYNTAAITFDDGYADVLHNAKPALERFDCPATVFLTTRAMSDQRVFWWDILSRILLETPRLPDQLSLEISGQHHVWKVRSHDDPPISGSLSREDLHEKIHGCIRCLDPAYRLSLIERLAEWAVTDAEPRPGDRAMTADEVGRLSALELIEIGAHSLTHPSLSMLKAEDRRREIVESRRECEELVGKAVVGFAYPFGDFDQATMSSVDEAQFDYACNTLVRPVSRPRHARDFYDLPRVYVADWGDEDFSRRVLRHG